MQLMAFRFTSVRLALAYGTVDVLTQSMGGQSHFLDGIQIHIHC
jgi:hypothetical protein